MGAHHLCPGLDLGANDAAPGADAYTAAFNELVKENVNLVVAPNLATATALSVLGPIVENAENNSRDVIAVVGSDADTVANITGHVSANDRFILTAPGIRAFDNAAKADVNLNGRCTAGPGGPPGDPLAQSSPTNKQLPGVTKLARRFGYSETKDLINGGVLVLEERQGVRAGAGDYHRDGGQRGLQAGDARGASSTSPKPAFAR